MMRYERGVHTLTLTCKSSYTGIQNVRENNACYVSKGDKFHLNTALQIDTYKKIGVKIQLHQSLVRQSWISLIINPSSLLADQYEPVALFAAEKPQLKTLRHRLQDILDALKIDRDIEEFMLRRCDITYNFYCDTPEKLSHIHAFQKSYRLEHYKVRPFLKADKNTPYPKEANRRCWTLGSKQCAFSVYDKNYELEQRHGIVWDESILRMELRLESKRIKKLTKEKHWWDQLRQLVEDQPKSRKSFYTVCIRMRRRYIPMMRQYSESNQRLNIGTRQNGECCS